MNFHDRSAIHLSLALEYARRGFHVFPITPEQKKPPLIEDWQTKATTDEATIRQWWHEWPQANIGAVPVKSACFVVDLDTKGQNDGVAALDGLSIIYGDVPDTWMVRTPSGGVHLWFRGEAPTSAGKIEAGIDVRGGSAAGASAGYVLMPGSTVNGASYVEVEGGAMIAAAPDWLLALANKSKHAPAVAPEGVEIDAPSNVERATAFLKTQAPAIEGQGGDAHTFSTAAALRDLGVSEEEAFRLICGEWNERCAPPWDTSELRTKVANAFAYAQNEPGAYAVTGSALEIFGAEVIAKAIGLERSEQTSKRSRFFPVGEDEMERATPTCWLIPDLMQEASMVLLVGETQSYKSFLALDIALAVASGRQTFGAAPSKRGPTFYAALEGRHSIMGDRRKAWRMAREIEGEIADFYVMPAPLIASYPECKEFVEQIAARSEGKEEPRLIVLETVNRMMTGLQENSADDAGNLIRFCNGLVEFFGCTVIAVHHKSDKPGASATRGSSAFNAGFDTVIEVSANRQTKTAEVRVRKHKDAAERETPWTFKGRRVGPSLVFDPSTPAEHYEVTKGLDPYAPKMVGAALKELGAVGRENGVTTMVLAQQLIPPLENETDEARREALKNAQRRLSERTNTKAGAKSLEAYAVKGAAPDGKGMLWCLPRSTSGL